jgi:endoglucanase
MNPLFEEVTLMTLRRNFSILVAGSFVAFGCGSSDTQGTEGPNASGGAAGANGGAAGTGGAMGGAAGSGGAMGGAAGVGGAMGGAAGTGGATAGAGGGTAGAGGGTAGAGGTSGAAGAGGTSGAAGAGGTSGAAGAGGTSGAAGAGGVPTDGGPIATWNGLKVVGQDLVDNANNKVQLRGFGLGGWLMPEPYMISWSSGIAAGPSAIRKATEAKLGKADSDAFWTAFRTNYVTRDDLAKVKQWGFNSIRLPFNANSLMPPDTQPAAAPYVYDEAEFAWVDKGVQWASELGLYVILDMHGAPGGQNGNAKISDSTTTNLFTQSATYLPRMVDLWKKLSQRYRSNPWVIAYDIMNEPVPAGNGFGGNGNDLIVNVYKTVTTALRADGDNKIMVAEAGFYAMEFAKIATSPMWDNNVMLEYHFYPMSAAASPFTGQVGTSLGLAYAANCPLWYGEGGETKDTVAMGKFVTFTKTTPGTAYSPHATGWAWWTTKKIVGQNHDAWDQWAQPDTQPWQCTAPASYDAINTAGSWGAASAATAKTGLMAMADALQTSKCTFLSNIVTGLGGTP